MRCRASVSTAVLPAKAIPVAPALINLPAAGGRRGLKRGLMLALAVLLVAGALLGVGYYFYSRSYFVGVDSGRVALFKGFPFWGLATVEKRTGG